MQARKLPSNTGLVLASILAAMVVAAAATAPKLAPQEKEEKAAKGPEQKEEKKGGGLFSSFRKTTGMKAGEEQRATASAGAKGVGEGKEIGQSPVSADARSRVAAMEAAKPSEEEMEAFVTEGNLSPGEQRREPMKRQTRMSVIALLGCLLCASAVAAWAQFGKIPIPGRAKKLASQAKTLSEMEITTEQEVAMGRRAASSS